MPYSTATDRSAFLLFLPCNRWGNCHSHWHYRAFSRYSLLSKAVSVVSLIAFFWVGLTGVTGVWEELKQLTSAYITVRQGEELARGRKAAYCLEDTQRYFDGPSVVTCQNVYDCGFQGVSAGWFDEYSYVLGESIDWARSGWRSRMEFFSKILNADCPHSTTGIRYFHGAKLRLVSGF